MQKNPHFDENLLVWSDDHSGNYGPPNTDYSEQFELQWKLALQGLDGYYDNPGASVDDTHIDDRVYEWTGVHPRGKEQLDSSMGNRPLDHPLDPEIIRGKTCVDVGCGLGRWTRTMQRIGAASVLSIDMSESALKSVSHFNDTVLKADIMRLPTEHPELTGRFEFACFWGVAMCTHDPHRAFMSAASTVKPGGSLYLMVYAPEGLHNTKLTNHQRRKFDRLKTVEQRLAFVDKCYHRRWDRDFELIDNLKNVSRNLRRLPKGSKVGVLDLLEPFYNWTIPWYVIENWMAEAGFIGVRLLNEFEPQKCAYHVLGKKA